MNTETTETSGDSKPHVDPSFTARNFLSFRAIEESLGGESSFSSVWASIPEAVKNGDVEEQATWPGFNSKLIKILHASRMVKLLVRLSVLFVFAGILGVAVSMFYTSPMYPIFGLFIMAIGVIIYFSSQVYDFFRIRRGYNLHTHGIYLWGHHTKRSVLKAMKSVN